MFKELQFWNCKRWHTYHNVKFSKLKILNENIKNKLAAAEAKIIQLKNENSDEKDEIKQLKDHNTNISAEGKILQNRMMGMQQDFNKSYKS